MQQNLTSKKNLAKQKKVQIHGFFYRELSTGSDVPQYDYRLPNRIILIIYESNHLEVP